MDMGNPKNDMDGYGFYRRKENKMLRRIRKIFSIALVISLVCISGAFSFAASPEEKDEICEISIVEMFESAIENKRETPMTIELATSEAIPKVTITDGSGEVFYVEVFEYNGENSSEGTKTYVYSIQPEYIRGRTGELAAYIRDNWDVTTSVYGYLTVTYDKRSSPNNSNLSQYLLRTVSGGWGHSDTSITLSDRYVAYACTALSDETQVDWQFPTSNSFYYYTDYTEYVDDDPIHCSVQAQSYVTLQRTSGTWQLHTEVSVVDNNMFSDLFDEGRGL